MTLLREVLSIEPTTEQEQISKLILATSYQLLDASWQDLIYGRLAAAMDHRRSIWEASDYLRAVAVDKEFALSWWRSREKGIKVEIPRRKVRDALNRDHPGSGTAYWRRRDEEARGYRSFSHVSPLLSAGMMNLDKIAEGSDDALSPMGYYAENVIRAQAAILGDLLGDILWAGFAGMMGRMTGNLSERLSKYAARATPILQGIRNEQGRSIGEMHAEYLKATSEEGNQVNQPDDTYPEHS